MHNVKKKSAAGMLSMANPLAKPMAPVAPPAVNSTPQITPASPIAPKVPVPAPEPEPGGGFLDKAKGMITGGMDQAKNWAMGTFGGQFGRAKAHYDQSTGEGQNPFQAGLGAFGQLDPSTRGIAGGGLGALGAGMLAPDGSRSFMMPAAAAAGTMFSMAHGPDGFKWENMLKPETLMGGGLAAGAGYLGSKLLGDDEEDDDKIYDPAGLRKKQRSGLSSMLPALLGVGALGLGGYGLYKYMNPEKAAIPPPAATPPPNSLAATVAAQAKPTTVSPAAIGALASAGGLMSSAGRPVTQGNSPVATAPASEPLTGAATTTGAKPGLDVGPVQPVAAPVAPVAAPVANPVSVVDPGLNSFINTPQNVEAYAAQHGNLPGVRQNLQKLLGNYYQSETPGLAPANGFPQLSDIYRRIHSGEAGLLDKAQAYAKALDAAHTATGGQTPPGLERLEAYRKEPNPDFVGPAQPAGFPIRNIEALSAHGFKDLNHLSQAAAQGDPKVREAIHAMGPEGQRDMLRAMTERGYHDFTPHGGETMSLPAAAVSPRASALLGALKATSTGEPLKPEPYDSRAFLQEPDQLRTSLQPGQKRQLLEDLNNPEALSAKFEGLSPEERIAAARNLGGLFQRNAYGALTRGNEAGVAAPLQVQNWIDPRVQTAMARLAGNTEYKPVGLESWNELSSLGTDSSRGLSPYADVKNKQLRTPEMLESQLTAQNNFDPRDIVLKRTPESDQETTADWYNALKGHARGNAIPQENMGPTAIGLQRLREHRPELYDRLLEILNRDAPGTDWQQNLLKFRHQEGLSKQTGRRHSAEGKVQDVQGPNNFAPSFRMPSQFSMGP